MDFLNIKQPPNDAKPAAGKLLIAEPFLHDTNFQRSVVLLCEHGAEGSVGFVLNNITEFILGDLLPELYTPSLGILQGGPVQTDTLHMLHRLPEVLGGVAIAPGIHWGGSYEALQNLISDNNYDPEDIRLFVGYSGWSPGQLDREMKEGSWLVADTPEKILFETTPPDIWKQAIKLLGKDYAYLINMPIDPKLN